VTYLCTIQQGKDPQHPVFTVTPEDAPPETGHSATAAWWNIYKEGLRVRNQPEQAVMNGDEMFGLYDNVIKALLQELPGADKLSPYIWRTFIEGGYVFSHVRLHLSLTLVCPDPPQSDVTLQTLYTTSNLQSNLRKGFG
jgi:F/Y rich C-terminus